jgi:flagellar basal-body rod modification protein FlgD
MPISNNIIGQYEQNLRAQNSTDRIATDKDTFLKLLVAQLTHQDPLNPAEDKEFIAQLAQFTQVEELQNINKGMEQLNDTYLLSQTTNAASLINTMVVAGGDNLTLTNAAGFTSEEDFPNIYFTLPRDSVEGTVTVWSLNEDGTPREPVYSTTMPGYAQGPHEIRWHGRGYNDQIMPNGRYMVSVTAKDKDGDDILVSTSSQGVVVGVETAPDGNHKLYLADGRSVNFNNIDLILGVYNQGGGTAETPKTPEEMEAIAAELEAAAEKAAEKADLAQRSAQTAREAADAARAVAAENAAALDDLARQMEEAAQAAISAAEEAKTVAEKAREAVDAAS